MIAWRIACLLFGLACGPVLAQTTATPVPAPLPDLGRLFYTPAEREQLERERERPRVVTAAPEAPEQLRINGYIARTGKPALPVVNGRVLEPGAALSGMRISGRADGRVRITPETGPAREARAGQTVDIASGETIEWFDLPNRKRSGAASGALPQPFVSGTAPVKADDARPPRVIKAKRGRRGQGRRNKTVAAPAAKAEVPAAPAPVPRAPRAAPAPSIPPPVSAPPVRP